MYQIGQRIRILDIPADREFWGIPRDMIGLRATVIECNRRDYNGIPCFHLMINEPDNDDHDGSRWYFPSPDVDAGANLCEAVVVNRWNPMNYVPRGEPLKLP